MQLSDRQISNKQNVISKINEILECKAKGCILRCKMQWYGYGQRSSKYFFSLEKARAKKKKSMTVLKNNQGQIITKQTEIINEQVLYFQELYKSDPTINFSIRIPDTQNKIDNLSMQALEESLSLQELTQALFAMPNNKTPGCDGLPAELYKILWNTIGPIYHEMVLEAVENKCLPLSSRRGVITLMPKKNREALLLKNWRSLTMLNVNYKIMAKALAN